MILKIKRGTSHFVRIYAGFVLNIDKVGVVVVLVVGKLDIGWDFEKVIHF